jgi:hypothetical protein
MEIGFKLCFEGNVPLNGIYQFLFDRLIKFTPEHITFNRKVKRWDEKKHPGLLNTYDSDEAFALTAADGMFLTSHIDRLHSYRSIFIKQNISSFLPSEEDIYSVIDRSGFIAAYLYNEDYETIQSTVHESNLMGREFSPEILESIKNTPYELNILDQKAYKTKFNPGSSITMDYLELMVAWKMWFGKSFFNLVPKERILSFPYASVIKELSEDIVYVQLYDEVETPYTPENVFKQWKWREWLDYEGLEQKYPM